MPKRRSLPRGSGSYAVIRALVGFSGGEDEEPGATALAAQAGISQPRVSQLLHHLHDLKLVDRSGHGRWEPHKEALLDRFLAEYPGPGGSEQYYYTLGPPVGVGIRAGRVSTSDHPVAVSADVGPDLIGPWRRPSLMILYARHAIDPFDLGLTEAQGRHDANAIMRSPEDRSVFPVPALTGQVQGNEVPLADPLQQIWDLQDLGGRTGSRPPGGCGNGCWNALTSLTLGAASIADDLGYVALTVREIRRLLAGALARPKPPGHAARLSFARSMGPGCCHDLGTTLAAAVPSWGVRRDPSS